MKPPVRPKFLFLAGLLAGGAALLPIAARAQLPLATSYATRDGRILSYVLACASNDGTFTALPCGISGFPVHVTIDGGGAGGGSTPTTAPGTASTQLVGVQGAGANALPVSVSQSGSWGVSVSPRSAAWTDASFTANATASVPAALAAVSSRSGLHVWNLGTATVCMNYTAAAVASGAGCAAGSVPIPAGSAYLEDQPANVSPEAISFVCASSACPLTIKVH